MNEWIPFYVSDERVAKHLDLSRGAAQAKLREACASGVVRSWKKPYAFNGEGLVEEQGEWELIAPSEWKANEIDLMTDADGCQFFVSVNEVDLILWLAGKAAPSGDDDPN